MNYKLSAILLLFGITLSGVYLEKAFAQTWAVQRLEIQGEETFSTKAVDENTVWAGARNGIYRRTTDGGSNWTSGTVPGTEPVSFLSIAAIDQNTAYFMGENFLQGSDGRIYKTSDGGVNWTLQYRNTSPGVYFSSIAFWDQDHGLAISDPVNGSFLIVTTTNGGTDWNEVPAANIPAPLPSEFAGPSNFGGTLLAVEGTNNAWFGTLGSPVRVFRSTDQGGHWTAVNTPLSTAGQFHGITTIAFQDSLTGFAGGVDYPYSSSRRTLLKTTDGGKNWTVVSSFLSIYPATLVYVPHTNNSVLFVTSEQGSGYSDDGGATWIKLDNQTNYPLTFTSPTAGWTAGPRGIKRFVGDLSTAVVSHQDQVQPQVFKLSQNYPNPFNPSTTLNYTLPKSGNVTLKIFNIAGQEIETLINGFHAAGEYELEWQPKGLPSGIYFYKLQAGEFSETKKLILQK